MDVGGRGEQTHGRDHLGGLRRAAAPQAMAADEPRAVTKECPVLNQCYGDADFTKYWECSNGIAYLFGCPAGLHWDLTLLTSNYPEQANRVEGRPPPHLATLSTMRLQSAGRRAHARPDPRPDPRPGDVRAPRGLSPARPVRLCADPLSCMSGTRPLRSVHDE
ncbi:chitin binding peritrophin-A domain-containing protein [Streptomyces xanthophaeus]|uniref:chitin binding peritrophin-A domain-containing protein n=1 Tax=Streptomyces xanthophaeus TaxID=67385 RepID=UPI003714F7E3